MFLVIWKRGRDSSVNFKAGNWIAGFAGMRQKKTGAEAPVCVA
jgi:hypothetical protein